jgi:beta-lactamase superfamily II metal-dependent hydrolase
LLAEWEGELDTVVLSHRDSDHANALPWLLERHPPRLYVGPQLPALVGAQGKGLRCVDLEQAGVLELGPGRWLLRGAGTDDNEGSRSLLIEGSQGWLLWCGDAEAGGLVSTLRLLRRCSGPFACVLLPHHGAATPHLGTLLEQCQPAEVWISAGARMELAEELDRRGVRWRWTERDGPLTQTNDTAR